MLASPCAPRRGRAEAAALQQLSDGRFELGIGTGRPDAEEEARAPRAPWGPARSGWRSWSRRVEAVRAEVRPRPAVTVAAAGPRALAAAGRIADTVALALPPTATVDDVRAAADRARAHGDPALALQLGAVGGRWVGWLARSAPTEDVADAAAAFLRGDAGRDGGAARGRCRRDRRHDLPGRGGARGGVRAR